MITTQQMNDLYKSALEKARCWCTKGDETVQLNINGTITVIFKWWPPRSCGDYEIESYTLGADDLRMSLEKYKEKVEKRKKEIIVEEAIENSRRRSQQEAEAKAKREAQYKKLKQEFENNTNEQ